MSKERMRTIRMDPSRLNQLADVVDPDELWRLSGADQLELPTDKRNQLDAAVALRRYASYIDRLNKAHAEGKSYLVTPYAENGGVVRTKLIDTPDDHKQHPVL